LFSPSTPPNKTRTHVLQLVAGAISGAITKTSVAPLERLKILYQIQGMTSNTSSKYGSMYNSFSVIIKEEGFMGLYKGNFANVIRVIPVYALKFAFNDFFKDIVRKEGQLDRDMNFYQLMLSGTLAGLFQSSVTFPLEFIRTRLTLAEGVGGAVQYKGIMDCIKKTHMQEGIFAFYKGYFPTLVSGAPYVGLQMSFYELMKGYVPTGFYIYENKPEGNLIHKLFCGAISGLFAQLITYPGDTVRRRMITNGSGGKERIYKNTWDCCVKTVKNEGVGALFAGARTNVYRCIPGAAIQFASYEKCKQLFGV